MSVSLEIILNTYMRHILVNNLKEIKKFYSMRISISPKKYKKAIDFEFSEWINDSFEVNNDIWTLPDLTRTERFDNFCRSIKKKIY